MGYCRRHSVFRLHYNIILQIVYSVIKQRCAEVAFEKLLKCFTHWKIVPGVSRVLTIQVPRKEIQCFIWNDHLFIVSKSKSKSERKSKSKKTVSKIGQCKQYNLSSHLKWVLVADKACTLLFKSNGIFFCNVKKWQLNSMYRFAILRVVLRGVSVCVGKIS